jgi:ABC-2 type transport system ATP-binding protein
VRVDGQVDELLRRHLLVSGRTELAVDSRWHVVESRYAGAQQILLVRVDVAGGPLPNGWEARSVGVEELALAYLRESTEHIRPAAVEATT